MQHFHLWSSVSKCWCRVFLITVFIDLLITQSYAGDWPAYRKDALRSSRCSEVLKFPLYKQWSYTSAQAPKPAWPEPGRVLNLLDFDRAYMPIIASDTVYFGSSSDDTVRAIDLNTGRLKWFYITGGPVRFAPQIEKGRLYFASDDGYVYCLDAENGKEIWKFHGGLDERKFIGQGRLISRWPARSGVLVINNIVYVTMGMWPSEGVFIYALDANTGNAIWCNDSDNTRYIEYPHAPSVAFGGPAPQGYLLADEDILVVPTGRSVPAGYNIKTGKLLYYNAHRSNQGGSHVVLGHGQVFASTAAWQPDQIIRLGESPPHFADSLAAQNIKDGKENWKYTKSIKGITEDIKGPRWRGSIGAGIYGRQRVIFADKKVFAMGNGKVDALQLDSDTATKLWSVDQPRVYSEVLTKNALILGQDGLITILNPASGKQIWRQKVEGQIRGLAVSNGRIVASNDKGELICFFSEAITKVTKNLEQRISKKLEKSKSSEVEELIDNLPETAKSKGYALIIGEDDSKIAESIINHTNLHVICVFDTDQKVTKERYKLLTTTSLYGSRISIIKANMNIKRLPVVPYLANLVVVSGHGFDLSGSEFYRVLRPCGGTIACIKNASINKIVNDAKVPSKEISNNFIIRGKLSGAFDWDSKNMSDERVRWPLELQWFGEPGPQLIMARHQKPPSPLTANGRMFVFGETHVSAIDAYNGVVLWERRLSPDLVGKNGKPYADDRFLYLRQRNMVAKFQAIDGKLVGVYGNNLKLPILDGRKVVKLNTEKRDGCSGSISIENLDDCLSITLTTNKLEKSIDDSWEMSFDFRRPEERLKPQGNGKFKLIIQPWATSFRKVQTGILPNMDLQSLDQSENKSVVRLKVRWSEIEKISGWKPKSYAMSADLKLWTRDMRLILWDRPLVKQGYFLNNAESVFVLSDNGFVSKKNTNILSHLLPVPYINQKDDYDDVIGRYPLRMIIDGNKDMRDLSGNPWHSTQRSTGYELLKRESPFTLELGWRDYSRTYGCSGFSSSATMDFFRSGTIGMYDREDDSGMRNLSGIRSGCGLTLTPSQGMLLYSESASDCTCGYSFATSLAMAPVDHQRNEDWALFHQKHLTPGQIRQSSLNLGAPGDRRDSKQLLWLAYPRPELALKGGYTMDLPYHTEVLPGFSANRVNADRTTIKNTNQPWIYSSQLRGLNKLSMDLIYYQPSEVLLSLNNEKKVKIDGELTDSCWNGFGAVKSPFNNGEYSFRHDSKYLYVAYKELNKFNRRGRATSWRANVKERDGQIEKDNHLRFSLYNPGKKKTLTFGVSASGAKYDSILNYNTIIPFIDGFKIDANDKEWKGNSGTTIKLLEDVTLKVAWNSQGLVLFLDTKNSVLKDPEWLGGISLLFNSRKMNESQQLNINFHSKEISMNGWKGDEKSKTSMQVAWISKTKTQLEAFIPWQEFGAKGEPNESVSMAIRFYNPKEPYFHRGDKLPFNSLRDRQRQFLKNSGFTLLLASQSKGEQVLTFLQRNHHGYLAYDLQKKAKDEDSWNCNWEAKVKLTDDVFQGEIAIPWISLSEAGIDNDDLMVDLRKPMRVFESQETALSLIDRQAMLIYSTKEPTKKRYKLRLHFAELDDVQAGDRVFSVALQGKIVLKDMDVFQESGGRFHALVKEISNITANRKIEIELLPKDGSSGSKSVPILNAVELYQE